MSASASQPLKPVVFWSTDDFELERVFPIRNLLADHGKEPKAKEIKITSSLLGAADGTNIIAPVEQSAPTSRKDADTEQSISTSEAPDAPSDGYLPPPYPEIPPPDAIRRLAIPLASPDVSSVMEEGQYLQKISERSQMVPNRAGPPGIVPGAVPDTGLPFYRCEDEPIHIPGAIQQFGALIALRYDGEGNLKVRIASENTMKVLHYSPQGLFGLNSFLEILEPEIRKDFVTRVGDALASVTNEFTETHLDVFTMSVTSHVGSQISVWCAIHISQGSQDLVICEFEENDEVFHLGVFNGTKVFPTTPTHTIDNEVSPEERAKSTTSMSEPLRVLQLARRRYKKGLGSMEMYNAMTQAQQQLGGAKTIESVLDVLVGLVAELTGFHRVMIYRFDNHKNGCVVSELIDPEASDDLFRGMHFPASDIPKQARDLYIINRIRILHDRDEETARFLGRDSTDFKKPLDLTHSYLRAMSPIHLKYLGNMGVRSSMSISIVIDNDLWGLVACHHYGDKGIRVSLPLRELCRNIGECASTNIDRLLMLKRLQARKPPSAVPPTQNPSGFIGASSSDLLHVFGADFGLLSIQDEARAVGRLDPYGEALALLAYLQSHRIPTIIASQNINADFGDLKYPPGIHSIAGLLVVPLTVGGNDFIVFFRKGQLKEVRWAGNPYEKAIKPGSQYLEPRASFKRWTETVVGMSKEWTDDQKDTAAVLSLLYGRFIEVWRQKESAVQKSRMTRLLLRNSSHEVRTPLNAIINYLEIALENPVEENIREVLQSAHKASRSLIYVIDDLLNLTKAEDGQIASIEETFDLSAIVSDAITAFRKEAMRKNVDLTVSTHPGLPEMVKGDSSRVRQIISNIISNAFQHSVEGGVRVDIRSVRIKEESSVIGITVQDAGIGMSEEQLDDLFQEFEQVLDEEDNRSAFSASSPGPISHKEPLGLGLAVVARYVRNMNGQIRVRSQLGKGTIFGIELPFDHAPPVPDSSIADFTPNLRGQSFGKGRTSLARKGSGNPYIAELMASSEDSYSYVTSSTAASTTESLSEVPQQEAPIEPLFVLVAEDNPINAGLLMRRLSKVKHGVEIACDGQACYDQFIANPENIDVILMDLQMPLVDGNRATKMIRTIEKELDGLRKIRPRVPIIAVSASLTEENRYDYIECGFDAWILKPVDFNRLDFLLRGIKNSGFRRRALYEPGFWERGGWFFM